MCASSRCACHTACILSRPAGSKLAVAFQGSSTSNCCEFGYLQHRIGIGNLETNYLAKKHSRAGIARHGRVAQQNAQLLPCKGQELNKRAMPHPQRELAHAVHLKAADGRFRASPESPCCSVARDDQARTRSHLPTQIAAAAVCAPCSFAASEHRSRLSQSEKRHDSASERCGVRIRAQVPPLNVIQHVDLCFSASEKTIQVRRSESCRCTRTRS